MNSKNIVTLIFLSAFMIVSSTPALAGWEVGAKSAYDSNVDRAVSGGRGDGLFTVYGYYSRDAQKTLDWTLTATVEGTTYARNTDLSYLAATVAPGFTYTFNPVWSVNLSPFIRGKGVRDSDQTARAYGGKVNLKQQWNNSFYTGEYYLYTDSQANQDVYSYTENAFGAYVGKNWTPAFFTEFTYEFSRGDSFQTSGTASTVSGGGGGRGFRGGRFSTTFAENVVSERVNRHAVGIAAGYDFTKSLFASVGYSYSTASGDLGTTLVHYVYGGIGYRF